MEEMNYKIENAYLLREASMLGVRESYRLVGKYVLTEEDHTGQARFPDGVARGDWYIDVHSATKGLYLSSIKKYLEFLFFRQEISIPLHRLFSGQKPQGIE